MKNIAGLMKQASQMQKKMEEMQAQAEELRVSNEELDRRISNPCRSRAAPAPAWSAWC